MTRIVVYSALCGHCGDDPGVILDSKPQEEPGVEFVFFTDRVAPGLLGPWQVRATVSQPRSSRRRARYYKINSQTLFPKADASFWVDASFAIRDGLSFQSLSDELFRPGEPVIASHRHPQHSCVYQEIAACLNLRHDNPDVLNAIRDRYRSEGMPPYYGMPETGIVARNHGSEAQRFERAWWSELSSGSVRDQVSFPYVCWRNDLPWTDLGRRDRSVNFEFQGHRRRR